MYCSTASVQLKVWFSLVREGVRCHFVSFWPEMSLEVLHTLMLIQRPMLVQGDTNSSLPFPVKMSDSTILFRFVFFFFGLFSFFFLWLWHERGFFPLRQLAQSRQCTQTPSAFGSHVFVFYPPNEVLWFLLVLLVCPVCPPWPRASVRAGLCPWFFLGGLHSLAGACWSRPAGHLECCGDTAAPCWCFCSCCLTCWMISRIFLCAVCLSGTTSRIKHRRTGPTITYLHLSATFKSGLTLTSG